MQAVIGLDVDVRLLPDVVEGFVTQALVLNAIQRRERSLGERRTVEAFPLRVVFCEDSAIKIENRLPAGDFDLSPVAAKFQTTLDFNHLVETTVVQFSGGVDARL